MSLGVLLASRGFVGEPAFALTDRSAGQLRRRCLRVISVESRFAVLCEHLATGKNVFETVAGVWLLPSSVVYTYTKKKSVSCSANQERQSVQIHWPMMTWSNAMAPPAVMKKGRASVRYWVFHSVLSAVRARVEVRMEPMYCRT